MSFTRFDSDNSNTRMSVDNTDGEVVIRRDGEAMSFMPAHEDRARVALQMLGYNTWSTTGRDALLADAAWTSDSDLLLSAGNALAALAKRREARDLQTAASKDIEAAIRSRDFASNLSFIGGIPALAAELAKAGLVVGPND